MSTVGPARKRGAGGRPPTREPQPYVRVGYRRQYRHVGRNRAVRVHVQPELKVGAPWLRLIGASIGDTLLLTVPKAGFLVISRLPDPTTPSD